jgi:hypothetical protein
LGRGQLAAVAKEHDISPRLAAQISKEAGVACLAGGAGKLSYAAKRKGQTFRPSTITGATLEAVLGVPVSQRFTYRAWAQAAGLKNHVTLYRWQSVERAWFVLFGVYDLILEHKGDNGYKLPHNGVRKRQQAGLLPRNAPANSQNVRAAAAFLRSKGALG